MVLEERRYIPSADKQLSLIYIICNMGMDCLIKRKVSVK